MIISKALLDGIIISIVICVWISVILKVNPRFEMKSYPLKIVNSVEKQTKNEKKGFLMMALPMLILVMLYLIFSTFFSYKYVSISYLILFLHLFIVFMIWNAFDLIIFDWLIFCKINPNFMILPGTKGHPAYKDYMYHFIGFLKGIVLSIAGSAIIAGIVFLIKFIV
ncbi:hypothetical protein [Clostridium senegalense]|uniref:hypothetical protein n=1 Tax=Clostridium senegalense TaxID=1465809 RepID=UPI00028A006F|nr:hypothetical protein [Clostridium senegalense]